MVIADLVQQAREDWLEDTRQPYQWSDPQLTRYANEAVTEACMRSPMVGRSYTISVVANTSDYSIASTVREITYAKLALSDNPLAKTDELELQTYRGKAWRTQKGAPTHFLRIDNIIKLFPAPIVNDTLTINATSVKDSSFVLDTDIKPEYQHDLVYWILYKAYSLREADSYNPVKASEYLNRFNEIFGIRHTAKWNSVSQSMRNNAAIMPNIRIC